MRHLIVNNINNNDCKDITKTAYFFIYNLFIVNFLFWPRMIQWYLARYASVFLAFIMHHCIE